MSSIFKFLFIGKLTLVLISCASIHSDKEVFLFSAPKKIPKVLKAHDDERIDNYFWMNERDTPDVLDFLNQENERTKMAMSDTSELQEKLFNEMKSRIKEDDSTVPTKYGDWYYYARFEEGKEYPIYARKKDSLDSDEVIVVDGNSEGEGSDYFQMTTPIPTVDQTMVAYAVDKVGRRIYNIHFKDMKTGKKLAESIENVTPSMVWAADNKTLFFVKQHPETLRSYQLYRYKVGEGKKPELLYEETDETFAIYVSRSKTNKWILLNISARDITEVRILPADKPQGEFEIFVPREMGVEYSLSDSGTDFLVYTNWKAPNFRIMRTPYSSRTRSDWKEVIKHSTKIFRIGVDVYKSHFLVRERQNGLTQIRVVDQLTLKDRILSFSDPSYHVDVYPLPEFESTEFRFEYESLNQPPTIFEEDFLAAKRVIRKVEEVPGFDAENYYSERRFATAKDGTEIPISVLLKKGTKPSSDNPVLLYGYGSYGKSMEPWFRSSVLSLVDRGFIFAIAHIRGGKEMGRHWYEEGRLKNKMNTFTDFIAAGEYLIHEGYTKPQHLYASGGSAGGLLIGAVINLRPDLFNGVVAAVPFVDVLTTMLDETIPLTTFEYREWGDPRIKEDYYYMKSYSPYDNVEKKDYPNILVTTGYHDSQVQYWEPAKWVAKLREYKTDNNLLLFHTEMSAGHSGASGRFERLKTVALEYSFFLKLEGKLN